MPENLSTFDAVERLRGDVLQWLLYHKVTQRSLAFTLGIEEQTLCDFLSERRTLTAEVSSKLVYLVNNPLMFESPQNLSGSRIVNFQSMGRRYKGEQSCDTEAVRKTKELTRKYTKETL